MSAAKNIGASVRARLLNRASADKVDVGQGGRAMIAQRRLNVAVTALFAFIVTVHAPVPVHAPLQSANTPFPTTRAVSVTAAPLLNTLLQVVPQLMPAGLLVTVPLDASAPLLVTASVNRVAVEPAIVNGNAFDAAVPGFAVVT